MKSVLILLLGGCLLLCGYSAKAQSLCLAFSPSQVSGQVGTFVEVQVVAVTFDAIAGMQFPMLYDKNVLEFQTISIPSPAPLPNFFYSPGFVSSIANPVPGKVALVWFDSLGQSNSVTSGTVLFTMHFKIIGAGTSDIGIAVAPPPSIDVFSGNGTPAAFTIPCVTSVDQPSANVPALAAKAAPNPFSSGTTLTITTAEATDADMYITDITGKICFQKNMYLNQGITGTEIANTMLQGAGMYFVHLVTSRAHAVQPIVFQ